MDWESRLRDQCSPGIEAGLSGSLRLSSCGLDLVAWQTLYRCRDLKKTAEKAKATRAFASQPQLVCCQLCFTALLV